jgi:hypothetical protein
MRTGERANRVQRVVLPVGAQGLAVLRLGHRPRARRRAPRQDSANLRNRQNGLRLLADMTDGVRAS